MKNLIERIEILMSSMALFSYAIKPAPGNYLDYQTKTDLIFPIIDEYLIGTGAPDRNLPIRLFLNKKEFE